MLSMAIVGSRETDTRTMDLLKQWIMLLPK